MNRSASTWLLPVALLFVAMLTFSCKDQTERTLTEGHNRGRSVSSQDNSADALGTSNTAVGANGNQGTQNDSTSGQSTGNGDLLGGNTNPTNNDNDDNSGGSNNNDDDESDDDESDDDESDDDESDDDESDDDESEDNNDQAENGPGYFKSDFDTSDLFFTNMAKMATGKSPHGDTQIWYSNNIQKLIASDEFTVPEGTVAAKRFENDDKNGIAVMIKQAAGYDPDNGDWRYEMRDANGKLLKDPSPGRVEKCIKCHASFAKRDYLGGTRLSN